MSPQALARDILHICLTVKETLAVLGDFRVELFIQKTAAPGRIRTCICPGLGELPLSRRMFCPLNYGGGKKNSAVSEGRLPFPQSSGSRPSSFSGLPLAQARELIICDCEFK
jgi:hypothetical protein